MEVKETNGDPSLQQNTSSSYSGAEPQESTSGKKIGRANLYTTRQVNRYIRQPRDTKCMVYLFEYPDNDNHNDKDDNAAVIEAEFDIQYITSINDLKESSSSYSKQRSKSIKLSVYCGNEDGTIAFYDFSNIFQEFQIHTLQPSEYVTNRLGYFHKRLCKRNVSPTELEKCLKPPEEIAKSEKFSYCEIVMIWEAHKSTVNGLTLGGHYQELLSCSEDHAIFLWTRQGVLKGVLTYGKELDKIARPRWNSLVDMQIRDKTRTLNSMQIVSDLRLKPTPPHILKQMMMSGLVQNNRLVDRLTLEKLRKIQSNQLDATKSSLISNIIDYSKLPDHVRVVEQLHNKITYDQSTKDIALEETVKKETKMLQDIRNIGVVI